MAKLLKLDLATVEAAIAAEAETDMDIPDNLMVLTSDELGLRDKAKDKIGYDRGAEASIEMFVKSKKNELGLEFDGKDPGKLLDTFKSKVLSDAKVAPNEVVVEKDSIIAGLRTNLATLEKEKNELGQTISQVKTEGAILRAVPANLVGVDAEEVLLTMRNKGFSFEEKDGAIVAKKNGELVANTAMQALPITDVIKSYATERKWLAEEGAGAGADRTGRGGGSSKASTGAATKLSEAEKQWVESGKNSGTADYQRHIESLVKENPSFDLNA